MAEKETVDVMVNSGHTYKSCGRHALVPSELIWPRGRDFDNHQSSRTEWEDGMSNGRRCDPAPRVGNARAPQPV